MIALIDSSVLLRMLLDQRGMLAERKKISLGVASRLVEVECLRTLDRRQLNGDLSTAQAARRIEALYAQLEQLEMVEVTPAILRRASQPLSVPLGTLDAIHLATAAAWRDDRDLDITIATHDRALAAAARAAGFAVIGAE
jgi:predicted nucleic acid-binding protein